MSGSVVETVDFDELVGETTPITYLNCKEISRLNSLGVKKWIVFFEKERSKGTQLRFVEASPAVVEQINLIRNFVCGGTVESIYVPFACTNPACKKSLMGLFNVESIRKHNMQLPTVKCQHCQSTAVFDDLEEEYFRFVSP